jgi:hypothetical protein
MLTRRVVTIGEPRALKEDAACVTLCKPDSHILVLRALASTSAVSLVIRHDPARPIMTRQGSFLHCGYADCRKTTDDKQAFGHIHHLDDQHRASYSIWLKPQHDGVVCNRHYTMLRRQVARQQQAQSVARMEELLAAPLIIESSSSAASASRVSSDIQMARSSSVPLLPNPPPSDSPRLRRSASTPLLYANHVGCDRHQRRRIAFACAMAGVTWTTWNRLEANANTHSMDKTTWYRLTKEVWQTIEAVKDDRDTAYAKQLLAANQPIVVVADGAWSHPGFTARQHDWVLLNAADNKAIFSIPLYRSRECLGKVVHQGNYDDGSSKGMEGYALDIAIKKLQASGLASLITGWVGDQDSSVLKQLRECPAAQRWEVHLDPGHAKKNLQKTLIDLFGSRQEFDGLAKRIATFIMRITKRAESEHAGDVAEMRNQFLLWLDCVVPHYTQTCGLDCPHHQNDTNEDGIMEDSPAKTYLHTAAHAAQIAVLQSLIDRMKQTTRYFIHGHNTCSVERYHRERLKLTPKLYEFWVTWEPRCALNQLLHNDGYAETHRLVLAKLEQRPSWTLDIDGGNQYVEAMDRERTYHSARKSLPGYNRRQDQLAREFGKRRAEHDRASQSHGHEYQHTPPLFGEEEKTERRRRRTAEERKSEEDKAEAERTRLQGLYDAGDTTFTTLGVIDVNLRPKGRKAKKAKASTTTGKENVDPASATHDATSSAAGAVLVAIPRASAAPLAAPSAARAIAFR